MSSSRHRKEAHNFNLQSPEVSRNGLGSPSDGEGGPKVSAKDKGNKAEGESVTQTNPIGKIEVSPRAVSHLASRAAQSCYGVVGLASRHARPGWAELLRREEEHKGVEVKFTDGRVVIDLYVVIEYGTRISEVARNVMSTVKFAAESALGVPVVQVNVNVQGIRVSS